MIPFWQQLPVNLLKHYSRKASHFTWDNQTPRCRKLAVTCPHLASNHQCVWRKLFRLTQEWQKKHKLPSFSTTFTSMFNEDFLYLLRSGLHFAHALLTMLKHHITQSMKKEGSVTILWVILPMTSGNESEKCDVTLYRLTFSLPGTTPYGVIEKFTVSNNLSQYYTR